MSNYAAQLKKTRGRRLAFFVRPDDLLSAAIAYFEWCEENPLLEDQVFHHRGQIVRTDLAKPRAFTKNGLATFIGMPVQTLNNTRKRGDEWVEVMDLIEQTIYTQKFEYAAAGIMNSTIISRDLGLADKQEVGGIENATPVSFNITPVKSGTFLPE